MHGVWRENLDDLEVPPPAMGSEPAQQEMGKNLCGVKTHLNVSARHCHFAFLKSSEPKSPSVCSLGAG